MAAMKKLKLNKTTKNNLITYGIVILAYIIVEAMLAGGQVSSLMKGLLVPLCVYVILAVSPQSRSADQPPAFPGSPLPPPRAGAACQEALPHELASVYAMLSFPP